MAEIRADGWPIAKHDDTNLGKIDSPNAVSVLWAKRLDDVVPFVDPENYCILGNTYSPEGVSLAIRNMLAHAGIRHLVVCGPDLHLKSGQAFVNLWEQGLNDDHSIPGVNKTVVHPEIPREAVDRLRQRITVHDLREWSIGRIQADLDGYLNSLPQLPSLGEPEVYPMPEIKAPEKMPSEIGAHLIRAKTIGEGWLKILREVMTYGDTIPTIYGGEPSRDLTDLIAVITDEDPDNPIIEDYFPFSKDSVQDYMREFLSAEVPEGVHYTYGERIHAFRDMGQNVFEAYRDFISKEYGLGNLPEEFKFADRVYRVGDRRNIDQLAIMIEKLNRIHFDRGAIAILYDPIWDNLGHAQNPEYRGFRNPCAVLVQATVKDDALTATAFFRSNDMADAWPTNAFGLRAVQSKIAKAVGVKLGPLVTISDSAHIYEHSWGMVKRVLEENGSKIGSKFEVDPRGVFIINVNAENEVIAELCDPLTGAPLGIEVKEDGNRRRMTESMGIKIDKMGLVSQPGHGIYLGRELHIAEMCAKLGLTYRQEDPDGFLEKLLELQMKSYKYDELIAQGLIQP